MISQEYTELEEFFDGLERIYDIERFAQMRAIFEHAVFRKSDTRYVLVKKGLLVRRAVNAARMRIGASDQAEHARGSASVSGEAAGSPALDVDFAAGDPLFI